MSSSDRIIAKESLTAYERWELPNVEEPDSGSKQAAESLEEPEPQEERPQLPTAEEIEAIQKEAYLEAYNAGYEKGREEGKQVIEGETRSQVTRMEQVLHALAEPLADVDDEVEGQLAELAVAIARQVIRRELRIDPGQVVAVVRESLAALPVSAQEVKLYLHPEDASLVKKLMPTPENDGQAWRIVEDPALTRGGCRVVSDHSRIDMTLEKQVAAVVTRVLGGERRDDSSEKQPE